MQILHIIQWPAFFFSDVSLARITDIGPKSDEELQRLKNAGFDGLTIGMETADDEALQFMNKGYGKKDILVQCGRLEQAGISYKFFYLE